MTSNVLFQVLDLSVLLNGCPTTVRLDRTAPNF